MVKFLSGSRFVGNAVPLCAFWRNDLRTDPSKELSKIEGTGQTYAQEGKGKDSAIGSFAGQCIANAFFAKSTITCFNNGQCNGEGKCLTCSYYRYGGLRMAISHSPPLEVLRYYNKGLTEDEIRSPNLVSFPRSAVQGVDQDQLPYHILLRNIQAEIAKCCHWSEGDGAPSRFFIATIVDGPTSAEVTDANGNLVRANGILVKNSVFPDQVGTFFPVGTTVVAGFEDQPSFYLEPRTGLVKSGAGILFDATSGGTAASPNTIVIKTLARNISDVIDDAVNAAALACQTATNELTKETAFYNNALNTHDTATIAAAQLKYDAATANKNTACNAYSSAQTQGTEATALVSDVLSATTVADIQTNGEDLADKLNELADTVETAGSAVGSTSAADETETQVAALRTSARYMSYSSQGGVTKCEFAYQQGTNLAESWNTPADGSLPCNGVRTDCPYYTGEEWLNATDENMEIGHPILAEQIQEVRFRSDDWSRYENPEEEFRNRFTTPFIWAFIGYADVSGEPAIEDMLLYKPNRLFSRGISGATYQTIKMEKVSVSDFDDFAVSKNVARIQPGSETLDRYGPPQYPSFIAQPIVPTATRLSITHPRLEDEPFIYRIWSPDKNKITIFGKASPEQTIYLVNNTALWNRWKYHAEFGTKDFFDVPGGLPKAPNFTGLTAAEILNVVSVLRNEKEVNADIEAPLGFDEVNSDRGGFWESIQEIDLVHNEINEIYAFLIAGETSVLTTKTTVDCRFLHSIVKQTSFSATDFSILDSGVSESKLGSNVNDTASSAILTASSEQVIGIRKERVGFGYGYFGWRFKDRGLRFGVLNADNDLQGLDSVADKPSTLLVTEAAPSTFIVNVGYHVVQYKKEDVVVPTWYVINDCGYIMLCLDDTNLSRVLPLPDQSGNQKAISGIFINDGGSGSEIAQWGLTKITLTTPTGDKELVQIYRDADGFGLPANYVVVGPKAFSSEESAFGRPVPGRDTITVSYTFLRAQSAKHDPEGSFTEPKADPELGNVSIVTDNFFGDSIRTHRHDIQFDGGGGLIAGGTIEGDRISQDQQDYVFVFTDSIGRPIGKKVVNFYVMYYNLSCINVEIFYRWSAACTTYALIPDLLTNVGTANGTVLLPPGATVDATDNRLTLGFRVQNLLGDRDCIQQPNCGDHEFVAFGPLRREFEVITRIPDPEADPGDLTNPTVLKANFPSAGGPTEGEIVSSFRPGTQFLNKHGPMWYPYTTCERPRYLFNTGGPFNTDSTELINSTLVNPGIVQGATVVVDKNTGTVPGQAGLFGGLPDQACEAYHGPDQVKPLILDIHPSLKPCTSAYTYGNQITKAGENRFSGYARRRGVIDTLLYDASLWEPPPFGNFGRPRLVFELSNERGDYLGGATGSQVGRRWMPMFPTRENMGATLSIFSEEIEPAGYRLLCSSTPVGDVNEEVPTRTITGNLTILGAPRYTQKQLVVNKTAAAIEFPFSPYYPMFLPEGELGDEPNSAARVPTEEGLVVGPINTMWAWREQEKSVQRGVTGGSILKGIKLDTPDYFIDNRRLEVKLRPDESTYSLVWTMPTYNLDGSVNTNAALRLGVGPAREIVIDFENRLFEVADQTGTVYDSTQELGDVALPCEENTATDNMQLDSRCSCISDVTDSSLLGPPVKLPARFMHLDELAPDGYFALYSTEALQTPFAIDIPRTSNNQPCCMCVYYIPGIFFSLNDAFLPVVTDIDPAYDARLEPKYTWSRVPHGYATGVATDGAFNTYEQLADNFIPFDRGEVFVTRIIPGQSRLDLVTNGGAVFPSTRQAASLTEGGGGIAVSGYLATGDPKLKGGLSVEDGYSRGEDEEIVLTILFNTYVKITRASVTFYAGQGFEAPMYNVGVVPVANRVDAGGMVTTNTPRIVGTATGRAIDGDIPNRNNYDDDDVREGRAKFISTVIPSYEGLPFWESYGMEWQLRFPQRGSAQSMGIVSVALTVDAFVNSYENTELIGIRERKYYRSTGTVPNDLNPERFLGELDSATAYWRTTEKGSFSGHNRHRAYAWGDEITDNQDRVPSSDIEELEGLQKQEYDTARSLLGAPYTFVFQGFTPLDEAKWLNILGETRPSWNLTLTHNISEVDKVRQQSNQELLYGEIPHRVSWNAPGHAWVHNWDETYAPCCFDCAHSQLIDYDYIHLHDNLALVETAGFWEELPGGLMRILRSTLIIPDQTFQGGEAGVGDTVLIDERYFQDSQGNTISSEVLEASGFSRDPTTGHLYVDGSAPQTGAGGDTGPGSSCRTTGGTG